MAGRIHGRKKLQTTSNFTKKRYEEEERDSEESADLKQRIRTNMKAAIRNTR